MTFETFRNLMLILGFIGIPSIFSVSLWCAKKCREYSKQLKTLHAAQKAQMRAQLMDRYYEIKARGYAWADELDEWVNQYNAYHDLVGPNAVLDSRKTELLALPTQVR